MKKRLLLFFTLLISLASFGQGSQTNTPLPNASSEVKALSSGKSANVKVNSSTTVNNATTTVSESGKSATETISTSATTAKVIETATVGTRNSSTNITTDGTQTFVSTSSTDNTSGGLVVLAVNGTAGSVSANGELADSTMSVLLKPGRIELHSQDVNTGDFSDLKLKTLSLDYVVQSGSTPANKATHFVDWTKSETKLEDGTNTTTQTISPNQSKTEVGDGIQINSFQNDAVSGLWNIYDGATNESLIYLSASQAKTESTDGTNTSTTTVTPAESKIEVTDGATTGSQTSTPYRFLSEINSQDQDISQIDQNLDFIVTNIKNTVTLDEYFLDQNLSGSTEIVTGASSQVTTVTKTATQIESKVENSIANSTVVQTVANITATVPEYWIFTGNAGYEQSNAGIAMTVSDMSNASSITQNAADVDFSAVRVTFDAKVKGLSDQNSISAGTYTVNVTNETVYVVFTGTTSTMTFPGVSGNTGTIITFVNKGSGLITTATPGAANIIWVAGTTTNTTAIANGTISSYYCDGTNWISL